MCTKNRVGDPDVSHVVTGGGGEDVSSDRAACFMEPYDWAAQFGSFGLLLHKSSANGVKETRYKCL